MSASSGSRPTKAESTTARFRAAHSRLKTIAVTGTNGKTSTVSMVEAVVRAVEPSARLTTLGAWVSGERVVAANPTEEFLACVESSVEAGVRTLALEVTSKALLGGLAKRWPPHVAVFTNLSRDHLDMHQTPEGYLAAKAQLFMAVSPRGAVVLNAADPSSQLIAELVPEGARIRWYADAKSERDAVLFARRIVVDRHGTLADFDGSFGALLGSVQLGVFGEVHAQNAMAAALAADSLGYAPDAIREGLQSFVGVPGRFEVVSDRPFVVVDYAHTPDGLLGTLDTARRLVQQGRLICVFGCGGRRDTGKRSEMGAVADCHADLVVVTNDNPREEDPAQIAAAVESGATGNATWIRELDRRNAIARAIDEAKPGDVVVVAGKGHESTQEIGGEVLPFDDARVIRALLVKKDPI